MEDRPERLEHDDIEQHHEMSVLLPWYLNQTLSPEEQTRVTNHLRECATCQHELEELHGLRQIAASPVPAVSSALLDETLHRIRALPVGSKPERFSWRAEWQALRRPRLALSVAALVLVFLGVGLLTGVWLSESTPVIGRVPAPWERILQKTEKYFAFPRDIVMQGTLTTQIGNRAMAKESYILEKLTEGDLLLTSKIESNELSEAGEAVQRLRLGSDYRPLTYVLQGPLVYGGNRAEAVFSGGQVTLSLAGREVSKRVAPVVDFPVLLDFSAMSQFALFHRLLSDQARLGKALEGLRFTAFSPQALRAEPLRVRELDVVMLRAPSRALPVTARAYELLVGPTAGALRVRLFALPDRGELALVYFPAQQRLPAPGAIVVYRSDLYPQGLEMPEEP